MLASFNVLADFVVGATLSAALETVETRRAEWQVFIDVTLGVRKADTLVLKTAIVNQLLVAAVIDGDTLDIIIFSFIYAWNRPLIITRSHYHLKDNYLIKIAQNSDAPFCLHAPKPEHAH